jgi:hypothetical protein
MQITGEPTATASVSALESAQRGVSDNGIAAGQLAADSWGRTDRNRRNQRADTEPEALYRASDRCVSSRSGPAKPGQSHDNQDAWPTLPVWVWLEEDNHGTWQARARLSQADGIAPLPVRAPVSPAGLTRLWLPTLKALKELETGNPRSRTVPVWVWTDGHDDEPAIWFSFDRVDGVRSTLLDIPREKRSLAVLRDRLGVAMVRLTGCETPDAAARELMKPPQSASTPRTPPQPGASRKSKSPAKKRTIKAATSRQRKMVVPRIRVVSGGLPGLGKRR